MALSPDLFLSVSSEVNNSVLGLDLDVPHVLTALLFTECLFWRMIAAVRKERESSSS